MPDKALPLPAIDGETPTIVHLSAEYYPYARTGGLAEAAWGLHRLQHSLGRPTAAVVPLFRTAHEKLRHPEPVGEPIRLHFGARTEEFRLWHDLDPASGTPTWFIEHDGLFNRSGIYGEGGSDYPDNHFRFAAFAAAAVAALPRIVSGPVLLHAHDWHASLASVYLRNWFRGIDWYDRIPTVMSIHNGGYQGHFGPEVITEIGLPWELYRYDKMEWHGKINFLKGGLTHTDMASTVSPTHAVELRTPGGGFGLHEVYQWLGSRFTGILNGIDENEWEPGNDPKISACFDADDLSGKVACKAELQRRFGLEVDPDIPVVAVAGRLVTQKGLELVVNNPALLRIPAQYAFLGSGERRYEDSIGYLCSQWPARFGAEHRFSDEMEHVLMAGADLFLMPSQYEPCGLTQMRAQRYGTPPVVRRVGGLADTVDDGMTGYQFDAFEEWAATGAMWRALTEIRSEWSRRRMQREGMARDFGWMRVAATYADLYRRAIARRLERRGQ